VVRSKKQHPDLVNGTELEERHLVLKTAAARGRYHDVRGLNFSAALVTRAPNVQTTRADGQPLALPRSLPVSRVSSVDGHSHGLQALLKLLNLQVLPLHCIFEAGVG
jgi:hypothetical protein